MFEADVYVRSLSLLKKANIVFSTVTLDKECPDKVAEMWGMCSAKLIIFLQQPEAAYFFLIAFCWFSLFFPALSPNHPVSCLYEMIWGPT